MLNYICKMFILVFASINITILYFTPLAVVLRDITVTYTMSAILFLKSVDKNLKIRWHYNDRRIAREWKYRIVVAYPLFPSAFPPASHL
jgi:hypothetical protein